MLAAINTTDIIRFLLIAAGVVLIARGAIGRRDWIVTGVGAAVALSAAFLLFTATAPPLTAPTPAPTPAPSNIQAAASKSGPSRTPPRTNDEAFIESLSEQLRFACASRRQDISPFPTSTRADPLEGRCDFHFQVYAVYPDEEKHIGVIRQSSRKVADDVYEIERTREFMDPYFGSWSDVILPMDLVLRPTEPLPEDWRGDTPIWSDELRLMDVLAYW